MLPVFIMYSLNFQRDISITFFTGLNETFLIHRDISFAYFGLLLRGLFFGLFWFGFFDDSTIKLLGCLC